MASMDPLYKYLAGTTSASVSLIFEQLEDILGEYLPGAARQDEGWWANKKGTPWTSAGWQVREVNLEEGWVVFKKS
jgi:hypothetical protein